VVLALSDGRVGGLQGRVDGGEAPVVVEHHVHDRAQHLRNHSVFLCHMHPLAATRPCFLYPLSASAPDTISISSLVMAAWRARFIFKVKLPMSSLVFLV